MATVRQPFTETITPEASQRSTRFDWIVVLLSAWWIGGGFLDGWAHDYIPRLETFFTPWHAVLYSGFLVVALFLLISVVRKRAQGYTWLQTMPRGYELSLLGVGIFVIGGVLDMFWHIFFGIEQNTEAALSPTHLLLMLGLVLTVSGPLRAAWQRPQARREQTLFSLLPAILSLTYVLALLTFFTQYANPIIHVDASKPNRSIELGIVSILLQTVLFMGMALFLLRRWQLPLGTLTILYTLNSTLVTTQGNLSLLPAVAVASLLTGLLLDLLYAMLRPTVERREALRLFAFLAPVVIQTIYFLMLQVTVGIVWTIHLWMGCIFVAGVVGLLLSFLVVPLPVSQE